MIGKMKIIRKQIRKSILAKKFQLLSVFLLTILLATVFNYLIGGMTVVQETYENQMKHSQVEDFRMLPTLELEDHAEEIIEEYQISSEDLESHSLMELIDEYQVSLADYDKPIMDSLAQQYGFDYQLYEESIIKENDILYFFTPYQEDISNFTIVEGASPNKREVSLTFQYAEQENINISDTIDILGSTYTVSGLHTGPLHNFLYSNQYSDSIMLTSNLGVLMNEDDFENLDSRNKSYVYLGKLYDAVVGEDTLQTIENDPETDQFLYPEDVASISNIENDISTNTYLGIVAVTILFITIIVILIILIRNLLDQLDPDFGILLAIGKQRRTIIFGFDFYILLLLFAIMIGSFLGIQLQQQTFTQMQLTYNLQQFLPYDLIYALLFGVLFIVIMTGTILLFVIRKLNVNPLEMINSVSTKKQHTAVLKTIKKWNAFRPFTQRFKLSFTYKNIYFLFTLVFSILIVFNLFLLGLNLITSNQTSYETYQDSIHYDTMDIQASIQRDDNDLNHIGYSGNYSLESTDNDTTEEAIQILAVKDNNPYFDSIEQGAIILNKKLAHDFGIETDDSVTINFNGNEVTFHDIIINDQALDSNNYMNLEQLWEVESDLEEGSYNLTFNEPTGSEVLYSTEKEDEIHFLDESIMQMNVLIVVLFIATTLISFILLILIANLMVNENTEAIQTLHLLGYNFRRIFHLSTDVFKLPIVLSVVLALAIHPWIIQLMERIINMNNSTIFIEINTSISTIIISVIIILVIYYIAFIWNYLFHINKIKKS